MEWMHLSSCFRWVQRLDLNLEAFMAWLNLCFSSLITGGAEDYVKLQLKYSMMELHCLSCETESMACAL